MIERAADGTARVRGEPGAREPLPVAEVARQTAKSLPFRIS
jgi:hypothetical protein